jgi:hypothetical protein
VRGIIKAGKNSPVENIIPDVQCIPDPYYLDPDNSCDRQHHHQYQTDELTFVHGANLSFYIV